MDKKRIGVIGLDALHAVELTKSISSGRIKDSALFSVVAAFPKGSKTLEYRIKNVPKYTQQMRDMGVEIVDSIEHLLKMVDYIILTSNDGHVHLEQALEVMKAGKPMFIDKPLAGNWDDAVAIVKAAEKYNVPVFSSSSLRFNDSILALKEHDLGDILGAHTFSPASLEPNLPELLWYGVHGIEMLFAIMGADCKAVKRISTPDFDYLIGFWNDGRIGTFRGFRNGASGFGGFVLGSKNNLEIGKFGGYDNLAAAILQFFKTGIAPVSLQETLKIIAFTIAADRSKQTNGELISLQNI
ncbi:gfo/Idh/MocA family oxidoreductase [Sphingobacterium sp. DK4209]|uniref:Gfo/Idh/MocA family oxidoreductase n=1 Tax=Sphingobacterium zhuxiongii TaxID=2662364 RepID=A0A5Q0QCT2_9SPHI|nr:MULTISPECIES: Gfo/Idh/MocA family oxidoreductase [unclassified Sphingobacterium]MVZ65792.1 gfo/Idh/MocA family oxidoreductase [Sphingobacterium sp. DK4209]QGA27987.1 gfo/Idh/MocA family oxidoreductase [Sphingobacterium sp. dk4302]